VDPTDRAAPTLYQLVGGFDFFERLVDAFYERVAGDDVLLRLYPEAPDLTGARHRLTLFLVQYWGGPRRYADERGDPKLRLRHLPFRIGPEERDHWLANMTAAVDEVVATLPADLHETVREALHGHFVPTAEHLRNDTGLPISTGDPRRPLAR